MTPLRIGFVGVGRMGANMARRLKEQGFTVSALYDSHHAAASALAAEVQTQAAHTPAEVAKASAVVITVVSDDAAMRSIFAENDGTSLLAHARDRLFINCATLSPGIHVEVERLVTKRGGQSLEACMAGSITQARQGTLYLMCGGKPEVYDKAKPVLEALGLDRTMLREVFSQTGAASRVLETDGEDMQQRAHDCYFSAAHAAKDSAIALDLAAQIGLKLPVAQATLAQYCRLVELGKWRIG